MSQQGTTAAARQPIECHQSTRQLVVDVLDQTRELVRLEVALARKELQAAVARAKAGITAFAGATVAATVACTLFVVAIALSLSSQRVAALLFAFLFLTAAIGLGFAGYRLLPTQPMAETLGRIASDVKQVRERIQ